jgi:hypothetical protein
MERQNRKLAVERCGVEEEVEWRWEERREESLNRIGWTSDGQLKLVWETSLTLQLVNN